MINVIDELIKQGKKMSIIFENGDHIQTDDLDAVVIKKDVISFKGRKIITTYRVEDIVKIINKAH